MQQSDKAPHVSDLLKKALDANEQKNRSRKPAKAKAAEPAPQSSPPASTPPLSEMAVSESPSPPSMSVAPSDAMSVSSRATSAAIGLNQCDLCQEDITPGQSVDDHLQVHHATLLRECNRLLSEALDVMEKKDGSGGIMSADRAAAFGRYVEDVVKGADRGHDVFKRALAVAAQLQTVLEASVPNVKLFMFGSCVSMGCWDGVGDIDFTLINTAAWDRGEWPPAEDGEATLIRRLAKELRSAGLHFDHLEPVLRTRVPVLKHKRKTKVDLCQHTGRYALTLKFVKPIGAAERASIEAQINAQQKINWSQDGSKCSAFFDNGLDAVAVVTSRRLKIPKHDFFWSNQVQAPEMCYADFDISARAHGIRNSWLLRRYMEQSQLVRIGALFVKAWSKKSGVNYSIKGYLTSYATTILWVYYLLQRGKVTFIDPIADVPSTPSESEPCPTFMPLIPEGDDATLQQFAADLGTTVAGFFRFYAVEFQYDEHVISLRRPDTTTREMLGWSYDAERRGGLFRDRLWYRFCIEDPYEENLSLGRHLSPIKFAKIHGDFARAFSQLHTVPADGFSLVLRNNTSAVASDRCLRIFSRTLLKLGRDAKFITVIERMREIDAPSLAAFEQENCTRSLAKNAEYSIDNNTNKLTCSRPKLEPGKIPPAFLEDIDRALEAAPDAGIPITKAHVDHRVMVLYWVGPRSQRLFSSRKAMEVFESHHKAATSVTSHSSAKSFEVICENMRDHVGGFSEKIANLVLSDALFFEKDAKGHFSANENVPHLYVPPVMKDLSSKEMGHCHQCDKRDWVFGTTNVKKDSGKYCDRCWAKFSGL